jgi:ABC-type antimicrobial peptide transport system permease subunit
MPVSEAGALRTEINRSLANLDVIIVNLGSFAVMGLLIAVLGLYGVISQLTAQRTRDIGVRIALGAQHRDIIAMVLGHGVRLLVAGLLAGLPLYYAVQLLLHRAMPEMPLPGWWLVAVTVGMLGVTALFACWLPAHRATRINPVDALRAD